MNIFHQLWKSLYSPKTISFFRFQGIGKTISYIFLLMLLSSLPFIIQFSLLATGGLSSFKEAVKKDLPSFTIKNGQLTSPETKTKWLKNGVTDIVFDPTGTVLASDLSNKDQAIGLLKEELVLSAGGQLQTISYDFPGITAINKETVIQYTHSLQAYSAIILPVLFILYYLFTSCMGFIKVSVLAAIGMLFKQATGRKLFYRQSWRLAAYAMTPAIILFSLLRLAGITLPFSFFIDWLITALMLFLAVRSIPLPKSKKQKAAN
ncbi:hypothetical protein AC623_13175 [Bacillus sp. FJAT-27231]|uniref:DUF1189 domain-containing protein n=1 Tax=Bacillus sp. FJAT-27231 TaxID=1679168 RepID=UPI0006716C52|nr:DUF1189 domain-containing protein [Bacillus sp. FJAT-27231]KMY54768.1 hypothetical protein AC623_13175 [Bacillus sp. FJAT-27231]